MSGWPGLTVLMVLGGQRQALAEGARRLPAGRGGVENKGSHRHLGWGRTGVAVVKEKQGTGSELKHS